jgi:hypothetical protein
LYLVNRLYIYDKIGIIIEKNYTGLNMKSIKSILLASLGFFGLAATFTIASCEQDPCVDLNCQQGASCSEGYCRCPEGYEGAECEYTAASRFVGTYVGISQCNRDPQKVDTARIILLGEPDSVNLKIGMGRTSIVNYVAKARTPELFFHESYPAEGVAVIPSATVDGNQLTVYLETRISNGQRSICKFVGNKLEE